jgi:hypothetical protein
MNARHRHELSLRRARGEGLREARATAAGMREALQEAGLPSWPTVLDPFWAKTPEAKTAEALRVIRSTYDDTAAALLRQLSAGYVLSHEADVHELVNALGWPAERRESLMRELLGEPSGEAAAANVVPLRRPPS